MKKAFILIGLVLVSCSSTPAPITPSIPDPVYPNVSGNWKGEVVFSKCQRGFRSDLDFTFSTEVDSKTNYIGTLKTKIGTFSLKGVYSILNKNFFFIPSNIQSSLSLTLTIGSDAKIMTGIYKEAGQTCSDGGTDAEGDITAVKQ